MEFEGLLKMDSSLADLSKIYRKIRRSLEDGILNESMIAGMKNGFEVLVSAAVNERLNNFGIVLKWFNLLVDIQSRICISETELYNIFESSVPDIMSYILGFLHYKPKDTPKFHYSLISLMTKLLSNVNSKTLFRLTECESYIISCIWLPIDFCGDYNTQFVTLKLIAMLLKCFDSEARERALEEIGSQRFESLNSQIFSAVSIDHFHAGRFENMARELLNDFNEKHNSNLLVYSMRCDTVDIGDITFHRPPRADGFWVDLNYNPNTLTFEGAVQLDCKKPVQIVSVSMEILKISLLNQTLCVEFKAPCEFSEPLHKLGAKQLKSLRCAEILLTESALKRLEKNSFIIPHYNANAKPSAENIEEKWTPKRKRSVDDASSCQSLDVTPVSTPLSLDEREEDESSICFDVETPVDKTILDQQEALLQCYSENKTSDRQETSVEDCEKTIMGECESEYDFYSISNVEKYERIRACRDDDSLSTSQTSLNPIASSTMRTPFQEFSESIAINRGCESSSKSEESLDLLFPDSKQSKSLQEKKTTDKSIARKPSGSTLNKTRTVVYYKNKTKKVVWVLKKLLSNFAKLSEKFQKSILLAQKSLNISGLDSKSLASLMDNLVSARQQHTSLLKYNKVAEDISTQLDAIDDNADLNSEISSDDSYFPYPDLLD